MDLAAISTEFVKVTVVARAGGTQIALAVPPRFAFLLTDTSPEDGDWLTGEWTAPHGRILIGPNGGITSLEPGAYTVWIKFAGGSETPVYRAGTITVY
ncbi:hypothetical protein ACFYO9_33960 [Streptomyces sp. NPDC005863]|uniref:hypothetical protein n=1 Tax=Streptomyces sp. NPDC005863 TaxID=3364735 RepID=UPI0036809A8F